MKSPHPTPLCLTQYVPIYLYAIKAQNHITLNVHYQTPKITSQG